LTKPSSHTTNFPWYLKLLNLVAADRNSDIPAEISELYEIDFLSGLIFLRILESANISAFRKFRLNEIWQRYKSAPNSRTFHEAFRKFMGPQYRARLTLEERLVDAVRNLVLSDSTWELIINDYLYAFEFISEEHPGNVQFGPEVLSVLNECCGKAANRNRQGVFYTSRSDAEIVVKLALSHWMLEKCSKHSRRVSGKIVSAIMTGSIDEHIKADRDLIDHLISALRKIRIIDPACGAGAMLIEAFSALINLFQNLSRWTGDRLDTPKILRDIVERSLFGCDTDARALAITEARLWIMLSQHGVRDTSNLRFNLVEGDALLDKPETHSITNGSYDIIIGNPPFVRHEKINNVSYKQHLHTTASNAWPGLVIDGRADLHTFFFFKGISLLKPGGVLSIISPNAWLDVNYGRQLQDFLLNQTDLRAIVNSRSRGFSASINTVITVATKSDSRKNSPTPNVNFITIDNGSRSFDKLISVFTATAANELNVRSVVKKSLSGDDIDLTHDGALACQRVIGRRWGIYHRAPDVFFELLSRMKPYLKPLKELGQVRYPIKTGINEFFFLSRERAKELGIESQYLVPVVKSPREFETLELDGKAQTLLFSCNRSIKELTAFGHRGAIEYIRWGSRQTNADRIRWPNIPSVRDRKHWYTIAPLPTADILCNRFFDKRFFFGLPSASVVEDQTFYGLTLKSSEQSRLVQAALLNSTFSLLLVELFGRVSLGDGVLQYAKYEMEELQAVDASLFTTNQLNKMVEAFIPLARRPIASIFYEVAAKDRLKLDSIVGRMMGINDRLIKKIYVALTDLVSARIEKASSINKQY